MKSWGSNMTLTPLLCPFSVQPGFWQAESRRRRNGCSASFCSLTQSGGWKVSQEICHVQQIRLWMARCGIQMGFWENRWCVRSGGLIMLFEFQLPWEISPGLSVALPSRNGRCVTRQGRCSWYTPCLGICFSGMEILSFTRSTAPTVSSSLLMNKRWTVWTSKVASLSVAPGTEQRRWAVMFQQLQVLLQSWPQRSCAMKVCVSKALRKALACVCVGGVLGILA